MAASDSSPNLDFGGLRMDGLLKRLRDALGAAEVAREATDHLARARSQGMESDWHGSQKELDFAKLVVATNRVLPPGGSIETGVLTGGTSALLIMSCAREAFHVSIDPYGLSSQSYWDETSQAWSVARTTLQRLHKLADDSAVTYCHYLMDSETFVRSDLLQHQGRFNIVHLDGDHSFAAVATELLYFTRKLTGPVVFVTDDHDANHPGVELALKGFREVLTEVIRREYDFPPYGVCGFSAWLYGGVADGRRILSKARYLRSRLAGRRHRGQKLKSAGLSNRAR
jgi:hypothetical protein